MKIFLIVVTFLILLISVVYLIMVNYNTNLAVDNSSLINYTNISVDDLKQMLEKKDFNLVDVHIPEQQHILGTDQVIAYNKIKEFTAQFPDKNEKIVLYCRSGSMSRILAEDLIKIGYSNIYNLEGGLDAWQATDNNLNSISDIN